MIDRVKFKDGIEISRLGLGNMRLPVKTPIKREANPMIAAYQVALREYEIEQKTPEYKRERRVLSL